MFIAIIGFMVLLLIGLIFVQRHYHKKENLRRAQQILMNARDIKVLIGLSQKHRGHTATFLQGNAESEQHIIAMQAQIQETIQRLSGSTDLIKQSRWQSYMDHWQRLSGTCMTLTVPNSFLQHTNMIENLLYILEDVAEEFQFIAEEQDPEFSQFVWRDFPLAIEFIGQARATGSAVATKGGSTQIDKVKLGYLQEKIAELTGRVFRQLESHTAQTQMPGIRNARENCEDFLSLIKREFIDSDKTTVSAKHYFETATLVMDELNIILDEQISALIQSRD